MNVIKNLQELENLADSKHIVEIIQRQKDGKIKSMAKYLVQNPEASKEIKEKAAEIMKKTDKLSASIEKSSTQLSKVANMEMFNLVLNGANLCATAVGFAIMNKRLNSISDKVDEVVNQLKKTTDRDGTFKFNTVSDHHFKMLEHKRIGQTIEFDEYYDIISEEKTALTYLYDCFMDRANDNESKIICAMIALVSMITCNICSLDELYYFQYRDTINDKNNPWPAQQEEWMKVYDLLTSDVFGARLQDYCFIGDDSLNQFDTDLFVRGIQEKISEMKQAVLDRQEIIKFNETLSKYKKFAEMVNKAAFDEVKNNIENLEECQVAVVFV